MSLLFPLYALGALAIAAPILFHFFQRKPQGQQEFSSLMFLEATPPKLTRRSRLSDLFLLLLRALALLLLVAAFGRPFLRSTSLLELNAPSRSVALLIDTSASMRRDGVWDDLQKRVAEVVDDLQSTDQVMLVRFDRSPTTLISFEAWEDLSVGQRLPFLKEQIAQLKPTWFDTDLSAAAITASDALLQQRLVNDSNQPLQVVLFTDLQKGTDLAGLQSYEWSEDIAVDIRSIAATKKTNASLQTLPPATGETDAAQVRVLLRNEAGGNRGQFQLQWDAPESKPVDVYVPPGQTQVVRITQPAGARQLDLTGDDHSFDNQLFLTETKRRQSQLWYVGDDVGDDQTGLFYYLRQCLLDTRTRKVTIEQLDDLNRLANVLPQQVPLCVVSKSLSGGAVNDIKRFVSRGGRVLVVLTDDANADETTQFLSELLDLQDVEIKPSSGDDYAMLADIDFQHPLFSPFADPRFNDFTKIRFWSHRLLSFDSETTCTAIAKFEDGSPALIEKRSGEGTFWVMTCGWQPSESQLALSTKFVPLLHGFFGQTGQDQNRLLRFEVGQPLTVDSEQQTTSVLTPDGETIVLSANEPFTETTVPGIYQLQQGADSYSVAVNLANVESQTEPLPRERLEQLGMRFQKQKSSAALQTEQRQMRSKELEGQQKLWRWGILAAIIFVGGETLLSSVRPTLRSLAA